jgi:hypothetical protein
VGAEDRVVEGEQRVVLWRWLLVEGVEAASETAAPAFAKRWGV